MRASLRRVERMTDLASVASLERLRRAVADDPDPAAAVLNLAHTALLAAEGCTREGTPVTWAQACNHLLNRFDERARLAGDGD